MGAINLTCRECRAEYGLEARYVCERCFGPLEVGYDHERLSRDVSELRRRIQGGPQNIWRYADFLPFEERPRDPLEPGLTPRALLLKMVRGQVIQHNFTIVGFTEIPGAIMGVAYQVTAFLNSFLYIFSPLPVKEHGYVEA